MMKFPQNCGTIDISIFLSGDIMNKDDLSYAEDPDKILPAPKTAHEKFRRRVFKMVSVGVVDDLINSMYDFISIAALLINLTVTVLNTYDYMDQHYGYILDAVEAATVAFFAVDYVLRLYTANLLYPNHNELRSAVKYMLSFSGIVDLLSFLPYYLPTFFPAGAAVFKMFRVARILRLFRINAYYDSLNVITEVILRKRQQLLSSVFIILVLMLASSLCMYSIEHPAQPEVFSNAFSGIWWSVSTLLTVGYGDIYPITVAGRIFGIIIAFLGVGIVAIPTGIISAGFVEQYSEFQSIDSKNDDVHFIKIQLSKKDSWCGKKISELSLPKGMIIVLIRRGDDVVIPRGETKLAPKDVIVLGAETIKSDKPIFLRELLIKHGHSWNGKMIRDLDISRQTFVVLIKRGDLTIIPRSDMIILENDSLILYSRMKTRIFEGNEEEEI